MSRKALVNEYIKNKPGSLRAEIFLAALHGQQGEQQWLDRVAASASFWAFSLVVSPYILLWDRL